MSQPKKYTKVLTDGPKIMARVIRATSHKNRQLKTVILASSSCPLQTKDIAFILCCPKNVKKSQKINERLFLDRCHFCKFIEHGEIAKHSTVQEVILADIFESFSNSLLTPPHA